MKAYGPNKGVAPLIFNVDTRRKWVVNFTPWSVYSQERTPVQTEQEASWASGSVLRFGKKENPFPLPGSEHRVFETVV